MDSFSLHISSSPLYLILGALVFAAFAFFIYKFTIPPVSSALRYFLISLRTIALFLILFLIFEPKIVITNRINVEPVNYIFYDVSRSTALYDSTGYVSIAKELTNVFENELRGKNKYFTFADKVKEISSQKTNNLKLNGILTDFDGIFELLRKSDDNVSSAVILSDGIYNDGNDPYYLAEKSDVPIFAIGFGDSSKYKDVYISQIKRNNYIYAGETTIIKTFIANVGLSGKNVSVSLFEDGKFLERKNVALSHSGIDAVEFEYKPENPGEKRLSFSVSVLNEEKIKSNNRKTIFVAVLNDKLRVTMITGSPSADYSFIKDVFRRDNKIKLRTLTLISGKKFVEQTMQKNIYDSTDVFVLAGFPGAKTSETLAAEVFREIGSRNAPYLLLLTTGTDLNKLNRFSSFLSFNISGNGGRFENLRIEIISNSSGVFNSGENDLQAWNELPPTLQPNVFFTPRTGAQVIADAVKGNGEKINPLIILDRKASQKSISFLAEEIWRWKLHSKNGNELLFDSFIENSVKWLSSPDRKKKLIVSAGKKSFVAGEEINFTAELYDDTFAPVNDAEVSLTISGKDKKITIPLSNVSRGIYEGKISSLPEGVYKFSASARRNGGAEKAAGKLLVVPADLEANDLLFRETLLRQVATASNGVYARPDDVSGVLQKINELAVINKKEKTEIKSIDVWADERILILLVLLFSIEWFIRKRAGML